jgi:hypothetical protein
MRFQGWIGDRAEALEQWIKEGKQAVKLTRFSCHLFRS